MWMPVLEVGSFLLGLAAGSLLIIFIRRFTDGDYPKSPSQGFLVQILTGIGFLLTVLNTPEVLDLIKLLGFFSLLILISFIDLEKQIIPNPLVLVFLGWGLLWQVINPTVSWSQALYGLLLGGGFLLFAAIISRGGMGGGDIKLMGAAGFALGLPLTGLALFIGSMIGAVVGLTLLLLRLKKRKDPIPFGPFLSLGIWIAMVWGPQILDRYLAAI
jgi:leader peptidase (prepilin peptidase) / N-methyltransferase